MSSFRIAHFVVTAELGTGGMGKVFKAYDESLNREVALKLLHPHLAQDSVTVTKFLQEARAAASINHPHVVQIYFCGQENGQPYIVMEMVHGRTLDEILDQRRQLPEPLVISIGIEATKGLQAGYALGFVHSDIKPANLFIDERHGVKILDFGLAKLANQQQDDKSIWGTPYYLPPERVRGEPEDFRSDIYSLGATLFHLLTGRPPFDGSDVTEVVLKRVQVPAPDVRPYVPNINPKVAEVVTRMLHPNPLMRFRDFPHLLDELYRAQSAIVTSGSEVASEVDKESSIIKEKPSASEISGASDSEVHASGKFKWSPRNTVPLLVVMLLVFAGIIYAMIPKREIPDIPNKYENELKFYFRPLGMFEPNINLKDLKTENEVGLYDDGAVFGDRKNGFKYGWAVKNKHLLYFKNLPITDERAKSYAYTQKGADHVWEVELPNGKYLVRVEAGDLQAPEGTYQFLVEDELCIDAQASNSERIFTFLKAVEIRDGRLTIRNGQRAQNNRLRYVAVAPYKSVPQLVIPKISLKTAEALLIVGSDSLGSATFSNDERISRRLQSLGLNVKIKRELELGSENLANFALIYISGSVSSSTLKGKMNFLPVTIVCGESGCFVDLGMVRSSNEESNILETTLTLLNNHGHFKDLTPGRTTIYVSTNCRINWGIPNEKAISIASLADDPRKMTIFGYRRGSEMPGMQAPATRIGMFLQNSGTEPSAMTEQGWKIFDATIRWALDDLVFKANTSFKPVLSKVDEDKIRNFEKSFSGAIDRLDEAGAQKLLDEFIVSKGGAEVSVEKWTLQVRLLTTLKKLISSLVDTSAAKNILLSRGLQGQVDSGDLVKVTSEEIFFKNRKGHEFSVPWRTIDAEILVHLIDSAFSSKRCSNQEIAEAYLSLAFFFHERGDKENMQKFIKSSIQFDSKIMDQIRVLDIPEISSLI